MIATCLVSQMMSSCSIALMVPPSSFRSNIQRQEYNCQFATKKQLSRKVISVSFSNRSMLTKLTVAHPSKESNAAIRNGEPNNIDQMPLHQLLQLLNNLHIRYPPNATRSELEELLHQYYKSHTITETESQAVSKSPHPSMSSKSAQYNDSRIVDAVVVEDDEKLKIEEVKEESYVYDQRERDTVNRQTYYSQTHQHRRGRTTNGSTNYSYAKSYNPEYDDKKSSYQHLRRRKNNFDLYNDYNPTFKRKMGKDVIDLDKFDIPQEPTERNEYYDNGMQIFLMGFLEAGKTAAQLALDSVVEVVDPFSREKRWYDEDRGRDVLDVNILGYSPDYRRLQRRNSRETGQRSRRTGPSSRSYSYDDQPDAIESNIPPRRRRVERRASNLRVLSEDKETRPRSSLEQHIPPSSVTRVNRSNTRVREGCESPSAIEVEPSVSQQSGKAREHSTKPIYGLYNLDIRNKQTTNSPNDVPELRHDEQSRKTPNSSPKKTWKRRLLKKFDDALGLQSPTSPSSSELLYDSWKSHVVEVEEGRKEALRKEIKLRNSPGTPYPNNRRARMRAKSNMSQVSKTAKSYLDEPPFWRRDGGTIASVLFDSQPPQSSSPKRKGVESRTKRIYNNSLDTLEALLRSPLGRKNTVTSLVLFITRAFFSFFGSLCRWAGVRGTIPQPIVVTTVFAMGISSRSGYRAFSSGLSLLVLRMIGEFIHGSLHGNEFWEDDYNKETNEWTRERS